MSVKKKNNLYDANQIKDPSIASLVYSNTDVTCVIYSVLSFSYTIFCLSKCQTCKYCTALFDRTDTSTLLYIYAR